jgi:hypothetical protein
MSPQEALIAARVAAERGALQYTTHARSKMQERNAGREDVKAALKSATGAREDPPPNSKWRFEGGSDVDGDVLIVVAEYLGFEWTVVTVF